MNVYGLKRVMLSFTIIVSVFSQITSIASIARPLMYVAWILLICYSAIRSGKKYYASQFFRRFLGIYFIFVCIFVFLSFIDAKYLSVSYIKVMAIPLMVTAVGDFYSDSSETELQSYLTIYVGCACVYAIWVHLNFFRSYRNWLTIRTYVFTMKNSAAQIWAAAILLLLFTIEYRSWFKQVIGYLTAAYLLFLAGISQCRTALLALGIVLAAYVLVISKNKVLTILCMVVICSILWQIPIFHDYIMQALALNKYWGSDLNTFSSGRLVSWSNAIKLFSESPIFGVGKSYVDCSYLLVLTESGIIGFILVESIWANRIYNNILYGTSTKKGILLFCMTIFYIVESVLEGFPPFGPGVSSFMFWFLSAMFCEGV